jgi:hypothetical protein
MSRIKYEYLGVIIFKEEDWEKNDRIYVTGRSKIRGGI